MGRVDVARTRRAEEVMRLEAKRDHAERHLNDGMQFGNLGAEYVKVVQAQRQAKLESIVAMSRQIAELEALDDEAVTERYCPDIPPAVKAQLAGTNFADTLARGPRIA
jgi:hypothetical protein